LTGRLYEKIEFSSITFHKLKKKKKFKGSHYKETVDIAKIIKMGSLHASQKWSFSEKKIFFGLNYESS
jgi:hypothetical protein